MHLAHRETQAFRAITGSLLLCNRFTHENPIRRACPISLCNVDAGRKFTAFTGFLMSAHPSLALPVDCVAMKIMTHCLASLVGEQTCSFVDIVCETVCAALIIEFLPKRITAAALPVGIYAARHHSSNVLVSSSLTCGST